MARDSPEPHHVRVLRSLTADRVAGDVEVLARGGLDPGTFLAEVNASLSRAVPHVAACFALLDPASRMLTTTFKFGDLTGRDERDDEWSDIEYGGTEPTAFAAIARSDFPAIGIHQTYRGDVRTSRRMREYMLPHFGYADELRVVARSGGETWGAAALFRGGDDRPFTPDEVSFIGSLSGALAAGLRAGVLAEIAAEPVAHDDRGPAVVIIDAQNRVSQITLAAQLWLEQLTRGTIASDALSVVWALAARTRAGADGRQGGGGARVRARTPDGVWLVLHAAPMRGRDGATGDVVVTIERARPPEVVPLIIAAFDLTPRERDVVRLVLQGMDTKAVAAALHLSAYTVQDHLKSVFEKAGVRSRRELQARVNPAATAIDPTG